MPSKSKAQQRFMGMVHALKKGEMKPSDASPAVKKAAKSMDTKSTEKYASTTHKGKPEKVKKEWLVKTIKELTNAEMEACGYTTSAVDPKYKLKSPGGTGEEDKQLKEAYGLDEMKMAQIDKEIKKKIKDVARKDRNAGIQLMNLYKKHWIEFMLKTKDLLSTETLGVSLVNPKGMKKQTKDLGESILNEMDYRGFVKYMNDFYGPKGIYPDKKKRTLGQKEIGMAYSVLLKKKPNFEIGFDSTDREMLRDILIKLRKLDPDYSQSSGGDVKKTYSKYKDAEKHKESVNESQPFADFPKFPKLSRDQQESLDELFGFAESYQIYNAFEKDPKKFIKTLDDMAKIRKASNKKPKGVNFNKGKKQFVKEGRYHDWRNDESMTPKQKIGQSMREIRDALNELDKTVKMNLKLKTELNMSSQDYWKNTHKALTKISERLVKMANKVGNLK